MQRGLRRRGPDSRRGGPQRHPRVRPPTAEGKLPASRACLWTPRLPPRGVTRTRARCPGDRQRIAMRFPRPCVLTSLAGSNASSGAFPANRTGQCEGLEGVLQRTHGLLGPAPVVLHLESHDLRQKEVSRRWVQARRRSCEVGPDLRPSAVTGGFLNITVTIANESGIWLS